ncbi:MAG: putative glycoside hydrolase [Candidatus Cloacimonetes bacterium]|nr:putative glycoside hydrolase [Candidatus Cloacimonadota bacterium]
MKRTVFLSVLICLSCLWAQDRGHNNYPRLLSYYLSHVYPAQNDSMITLMARNDMIVLDMEHSEFNPSLISGIRAINPDAVIVAYISVSAITTEPNLDPVTYSLRRALKQGIQEPWWMLTSTDQHASDWPGTWMLNSTPFCPEVGGQTWTDYLAAFISTHILANPLWDGVFLDNCYHTIPPINCPNTDCNNDSIPDDLAWRDQQWQAGLRPFIAELKAGHPSKVILGNPGWVFPEALNGAMFEEWDTQNPSFGFGLNWPDFISKYDDLEDSFQTPQYHMISAAGLMNDYQQMRYTLSTALMGNGYYCFDEGPENHGQSWWYDEYNVNLGQPLEEFFQEGQNMIMNGDFNSGSQGWQVELHDSSNAYLSINSEAGNPYAAVTITNPHPSPTTDNYYQIALKQNNNSNMNLLPNHQYVLRFRAKASYPRPILTVLLWEDEINDYPWLCSSKTCDLTTSWQYFEFKLTISSGYAFTPEQVRFTFHLAQAGGTVSFDDISLRQFSLGYPAMREFENGLVICNPSATPISVSLPETYYRIAGSQDPVVNSGNSCTQVSIAARDGIILLKSRPQITLVSSSHLNYSTQWVGTSSPMQSVNITNSGTSPLTISGISFTSNPSHFTYSGITLPLILAVNQSASFNVQYYPQNDGNHQDALLILNDSINDSALSVELMGTAEYPEPLEPQNVQISQQGPDAVITWNPVTQSIYATPFNPDCYLVFYNGSNDINGDYYFHGLSSICSYTHHDVLQHADHMLYRVHAFKASSDLRIDELWELESRITEKDFFKLTNKP